MLSFKTLLSCTVSSLILSSSLSSTAFSLPIGFSRNQGKAEYQRLENQHQVIYHDKRASNEAAMIQNSLTAAKPVFEEWFKASLNDHFLVISTAESSNASFANFLTNAIELQTLGQGKRDLFWHEYVHTNMYRHLQNFFGPAGALFHLPWMPAWFIEGLAESLSISVGSDVQAAIERYQALNNKWPTYDRIHSLYNSASFGTTGYATSGAFVSWILRQGNPEMLPVLLDDFFDYTLPWWWPWAAVPYNGFTPINQTLKNYAGSSGGKLYEQYKKEATTYWTENPYGIVLSAEKGIRKRQDSLSGVHVVGNDPRMIYRNDDDQAFVYHSSISPDTGWLTKVSASKIKLPNDLGSLAYARFKDLTIAVSYSKELKSGLRNHHIVTKKDSESNWTIIQNPKGKVYGLYLGETKLAWFEEEIEYTKLCWVKNSNLKTTPQCKVVSRLPKNITVLADELRSTDKSNFQTQKVWFTESTQGLQGDRHQLKYWDLATNKVVSLAAPSNYRPLSLALAGQDKWLLVANNRGRDLIKLDAEAKCVGSIPIADLPLEATGLQNGSVMFSLYEGAKRSFLTLSKKRLSQLMKKSCPQDHGHVSPLLYAMRQTQVPSLKAALQGSNLWKKPTKQLTTVKITPLDQATPPFKIKRKEATTASESQPASWRGRPIFMFPFVGANDPLGNQYGFVSVPLMGDMQNETLRASLLYGTESRFPNTDITFSSTRYWPTYNFNLFRRQTWNGIAQQRSTGLIYSMYYDERGSSVSGSFPFRYMKSSVTLNLGLKVSTLKKYLGPFRIREGQLNEPNASISFYKRFVDLSWSSNVSTRFTLLEMNSNFDYNVLSASTSLSYNLSFLDSTLSTGISGSRTRGRLMRFLKESYSPLTTFIPGSGGGYNQNSFQITNSTSLLASRYGDSKIRTKVNWTFPLWSEIDKWIGLAYIERLDFTSFFNYGGAWSGASAPTSDQLIAAHGYNLDLQLENKGVRFNLGLGTGQVLGEPFEVYFKTGFDALF